MAKVAINGLGRIGRAALKIIMDQDDLELVAVNDIVPIDNIAYLLRYDTAYGRYNRTVEAGEGTLIIGGEEIPFLSEKDPTQLPWEEMGVDIVFECTGIFTTMDKLEMHIQAGAKYVILSAPAKDEVTPTVVHGVNSAGEDAHVISCASCTTNSITPVVEVLDRHFGIEKAMLTTIHAYTTSQQIVDGPSKKWRRGRAGAANFVPTTTGAAIATTKALPQLEGKFDGIAVRGPIPVGSVSDLTIVLEQDVTAEEVNQVFREEAASERYNGVLGASDDELVSSDIVGDPRAAIVDLPMTKVVAGNMIKVLSWYDNEWGYTSQMIREALKLVRESEKV